MEGGGGGGGGSCSFLWIASLNDLQVILSSQLINSSGGASATGACCISVSHCITRVDIPSSMSLTQLTCINIFIDLLLLSIITEGLFPAISVFEIPNFLVHYCNVITTINYEYNRRYTLKADHIFTT